MNEINFTVLIAEIIIAIILSILYIRSRLPEQTIKSYKQLSEANEIRIKQLEDDHKKNQAEINELRGQVTVLKDVPLRDISHSHTLMVKTQKEILELIRDMRSDGDIIKARRRKSNGRN